MTFGLISEVRYEKFLKKKKNIEKEIERLKNLTIKPAEDINRMLKEKETSEIVSPVKAIELLKRTEIYYADLSFVDTDRPILNKQEIEQIDIQIKYEGYIKLQLAQVDKFKKLENKVLPKDMDYASLKGISLEGRQKLEKFNPTSIGQASRISGVSPADITVLLIYLEQYNKKG